MSLYPPGVAESRSPLGWLSSGSLYVHEAGCREVRKDARSSIGIAVAPATTIFALGVPMTSAAPPDHTPCDFEPGSELARTRSEPRGRAAPASNATPLGEPRPATRRRRSPRAVALTRLVPEFEAAVPAEERALAQRFTADVHELAPGVWAAHEIEGHGRSVFGALVLDGLLCQQIQLGGRASADLLGRGDIARPWEPEATAIPCQTRWTCVETTSVAILDVRFLAAARRWPRLTWIVFERQTEQLHNSQRRAAILALPSVEQRVLALFWHLADRWGVVRPEGIIIPLKLTHEFVGKLIGAMRPTVSLGLSALAAENLLRRDADGHWTLAHHSVEALSSTSSTQPGRSRLTLSAVPQAHPG